MADPVVVAVARVGVALTKVLLRACDSSVGADLVGDGQELVSILSRALRHTDESKGQIEHRVNQALAARTEAMRERCSSQGVDPDLLSRACTEVEIILKEIADDGVLLLNAVRTPESFPETLRERAARRRLNVESAAEPYFDELLQAVAAEYSALAPWSPRFQVEAFKSILSGIDEIQENSRRSLDAHDITHDKLDTLSSKFDMMTCRGNTPNRILFRNRPDVVVGARFVERDEHEQLKAVITEPNRHRTVLLGMRGCGKTQLAAALAKQCEDANWNLVAWINAASRESIQSDLVELAKRLKIDTSDQPAQKKIVSRCLDHLRNAAPADRLIVFDNVENIDHLPIPIPSGDGLRVVATTTNNTGWEYQDWTIIKVGVFDRSESINYLLKVTKSDDHDTADALAERLGDLPLAIAQAAAFAQKRKLDLAQYLERLDAYRSGHVMPAVPGDYYARDVATALRVAIDDTLKELEAGMSRAARRHLGVLALLAESGIPTRWLDPLTEEHHYQDPRDRDRAADDDAHDALTELIDRSIIQQSADGSMTMLHRLQAQVLRDSWSKRKRKHAYKSAAALLGSVDIDSFDRTDTESRLRETRSLIEQIRAISEQGHSKSLFKYEQIALILSHTLSHARDLGLLYEARALEEPVLATLNMAQLDEIAALNLKEQLAYTYMYAEQFDKAFDQYTKVIDDRTAIQGHNHRDTLTSRNHLAYAYYWEGDTGKAIDLFEQVLDDRTRILSSDHEDTLMTGSYLALAYADDGQLERAIALGEQVVKDRDRVLKPDHKHTLVTRNNLADAYKSVGRLTDAIKMYEYVLEARIRTLGNTHHHTRITRNDLAQTYEQAGDLPKAISMYEDLHNDYIHIYGADHDSTIEMRDRLEAAKRELEQQEDDSAAE